MAALCRFCSGPVTDVDPPITYSACNECLGRITRGEIQDLFQPCAMGGCRRDAQIMMRRTENVNYWTCTKHYEKFLSYGDTPVPHSPDKTSSNAEAAAGSSLASD